MTSRILVVKMSVTQLFFNIALVWTETVWHKIHVPCLPSFSDDCARKFPPDSAVLFCVIERSSLQIIKCGCRFGKGSRQKIKYREAPKDKTTRQKIKYRATPEDNTVRQKIKYREAPEDKVARQKIKYREAPKDNAARQKINYRVGFEIKHRAGYADVIASPNVYPHFKNTKKQSTCNE